jgi:hypothetical protein
MIQCEIFTAMDFLLDCNLLFTHCPHWMFDYCLQGFNHHFSLLIPHFEIYRSTIILVFLFSLFGAKIICLINIY